MNPLEILQQASSQIEEIDALEQMKKNLCPPLDGLLEDDVEQQWLSVAAGNLGHDGPVNPFPAFTPEALLPMQADLDRLVFLLKID